MESDILTLNHIVAYLKNLWSDVSSSALPIWQVLMLLDDNSDDFLRQRLPALSSMSQQGGVATAYVCQDFTCSLPVTEPQELRRLLLDGNVEFFNLTE